MDCAKFDEQVVRLEGIEDIANKFIRVRLDRVENLDLSLFEFDYDLTLAMFFLNAEERIYGRFGGRDATSPDARQSLAGLHHAMRAALDAHNQQDQAAPLKREPPKYVRDLRAGRGSRGCVHCHEVKEMLHAQLERAGKWARDMVWRYPLPDNLGLVLEVDCGNVVERVASESPAARVGLRAGDVVERLHGMPVHSLADAQYALDRAPATGSVAVAWRRGEERLSGELTLPDGWRKTDISWRPSLQKFVPSVRLFGPSLSAKEREALGLSAKQLAFRQEDRLHSQAKDAGIRGGDVILGVDGKKLEMDIDAFYWYVRGNYLVGDRVIVNLLRDGKRLNLPMMLR